MAKFYPAYYSDDDAGDTDGRKAETACLAALSNLDDTWIVFHSLEWRTIDKRDGEKRGETRSLFLASFIQKS